MFNSHLEWMDANNEVIQQRQAPSTVPFGLNAGERSRVRFVTPEGTVARSVRVNFVQFANGDQDGDQVMLDEAERGRHALEASAQYWVEALEHAPTDPATLRSFLQAHVEESVTLGLPDPALLKVRIGGLLESCRPERLTTDLREPLEAARRYLQRAQIPPRQQTPGPVTSVIATLEPPTTVDELVAYVTNDRDVTVDAWDVAFFALPEARFPVKTYAARGGGDPHATESTRPLRPHETRELLVMSPSFDEGVVTQPRAAVRMALFEDGRDEGSFEMRQQLLADRARDAVDVEYWLQVLKTVRNVSARVTIDALRDRLLTRKCQSTGYFHTDRSAPDVADVASKIELKPDQKTALIDKQIAAFDAERLALQKFVNR